MYPGRTKFGSARHILLAACAVIAVGLIAALTRKQLNRDRSPHETVQPPSTVATVPPMERITVESAAEKPQAVDPSEWRGLPAAQPFVAALRLQEPHRSAALIAAFEDLAKNPTDGLSFGRRFFDKEPALAAEYGTVLVGALTRNGYFSAGFELASTAGPATRRSEWMALVIEGWVEKEPEVGPELGGALLQQGVGGPAFAALIKGWANSAPEQLADYAISLPEGESRTQAFDAALDHWILRDPVAAAQWIGSNVKEAPEFDRALATLLAHTDGLFTSTESALQWSEAIEDPNLRLNALTGVLKQWAAKEPAAALAYSRTAPTLEPAQRKTLLAALAPAPSD